jgi:hypothetical protein
MFGHRQAIDDEPVYSSGDALIKLLSLIPVMSKWKWVFEGFFGGILPLYGHPWTISKTISKITISFFFPIHQYVKYVFF